MAGPRAHGQSGPPIENAARLVADLNKKLAALDGKVAVYQRHLLGQFRRYMDACLNECSPAVATETLRAMSEAIRRYPALGLPPSSSDPTEHTASPANSRNVPGNTPAKGSWSRSGSHKPEGAASLPALPALPTAPSSVGTSAFPGSSDEAVRSPCERGKDFQGVFTSSYLPIFEGGSSSSGGKNPGGSGERGAASLSVSSLPALLISPPRVSVCLTHFEHVETVGDAENGSGSDASLNNGCSGDSSKRRSALRRNSGSARGSPRRVRFEFQGEEVLTTISPRHVPVLSPMTRPMGPQMAAPAQAPAPATGSSPAFMSLMDVEGEEDVLPRSQKVSSTQALRALTKKPLEEGPSWTVVDPQHSSDESTSNSTMASSLGRSTRLGNQHVERPMVLPGVNPPKLMAFNAISGSLKASGLEGDDEASEDDFLSMKFRGLRMSISTANQGPPGSTPYPNSTLPQLLARAPRSPQTAVPQTAVPRFSRVVQVPPKPEEKRRNRVFDQDDDVLFEFEYEDEGEGEASFRGHGINGSRKGNNTSGGEAPQQIPFRYPPANDRQKDGGDSGYGDADEGRVISPDSTPRPKAAIPVPAKSIGGVARSLSTTPARSPSLLSQEISRYQQQQQQQQREKGADPQQNKRGSGASPALAPPGAFPIPKIVTNGYSGDMASSLQQQQDLQPHQSSFFVGSIDGRSGDYDSANLDSYRASMGMASQPGTPRSVTDRFFLEEAMEQRGDRGSGDMNNSNNNSRSYNNDGRSRYPLSPQPRKGRDLDAAAIRLSVTANTLYAGTTPMHTSSMLGYIRQRHS